MLPTNKKIIVKQESKLCKLRASHSRRKRKMVINLSTHFIYTLHIMHKKIQLFFMQRSEWLLIFFFLMSPPIKKVHMHQWRMDNINMQVASQRLLLFSMQRSGHNSSRKIRPNNKPKRTNPKKTCYMLFFQMLFFVVRVKEKLYKMITRRPYHIRMSGYPVDDDVYIIKFWKEFMSWFSELYFQDQLYGKFFLLLEH